MPKLRMIMLLTALTACSVLTACSERGGAVAPTTAVPAGPAPGAPKDVVTGLSVPWGIAFLPGGDALVTERDTARLLRVTPAGRVSQVARIEDARPKGEGGLMGVAVKDDLVFLYYTAERDNRIVRHRLTGGGLTDRRILVRDIPKGAVHNGGQLAIGPDGLLYAGTGETGDRPLAQRRDSLAGKILRVTVDGAPAPGNPFGTPVYSYGHRNVQGLAWDRSGRLYASEFGASAYDEINLIRPGANYGWPEVEGRGNDRRFVNPILTWPTAEASPSGMAYANGSLWAGALRGERLWQVPLGADGSAGTPVAHFTGRYGRLRAVAAAPEGTLWVGTSNKDGRGSPRPGDDRIMTVTPA
ncbi:PQQ-dependent sugar dehydrogenase [Nonomuraea sp. MG754425]|uniref:PQQ-dependent sugar dehydrogenase n=1 Tax=Nonomuraea sp. MG754425 TaxID=2570319 RepID=UPI001F22727A|nr:PQQ-dependent sugar dehydrogenase [Nonomuraea sp. MG754425]MCF6469158.1 PQQ-dependent sugar dehydrogenase [Nonomuraea sp. MG754425]